MSNQATCAPAPAGVVLVVPSDEPVQLPRELLAQLYRYSGVSMVTMPADELRSLVGRPSPAQDLVDESFDQIEPPPAMADRPLSDIEQIQLWRHIKWVLLLLATAAFAICCVAGCAPMSYTNGDNPNFKWGVRVAPMDEFNDAASSWP